MAKQTQDREDLLRDGTAMPVRGRRVIDGIDVVIGFRSRGQLSLYWDQDPVFQFDEHRRLRRVYFNSHRIKAEGGRLVRVIKKNPPGKRSADRLRLVSEPLSDADQRRILQKLTDCLQQIRHTLQDSDESDANHRWQTVGETASEFKTRLKDWMSQFADEIQVAQEPSA